MADYPRMIAVTGTVEPAPRRVRGEVGGRLVFDTVNALYVWEWPNYPQYYIPLDDVDRSMLVDEGRVLRSRRGPAQGHALRAGTVDRPNAAKVYGEGAQAGLESTVRFEWDALDAWFEEDEQVYVHPRNPYTRVDALRSTRTVRIESAGVLLAQSSAPVMVFETGLPTRYYFDRHAVDFTHLVPSGTMTSCPYKGNTSGYWSVRLGDEVEPDLAWTYDFPTRQLLPIAGLIAFYNEKVDVVVDGVRLERPTTHLVR
ncbi:DUF427 domain-containing protein [Actinoplanes sp. NPDC089786]|uniref:DUF427 domain-containing protein n=1 Tax=Actinoplanes sp. NPDC089786 TaxID=3155185 RepID=UPI0034135A7D